MRARSNSAQRIPIGLATIASPSFVFLLLLVLLAGFRSNQPLLAQDPGRDLSAFGRKHDGLRALDVRDYGARGDGITDDTASIQAAVDSAARHGGGVVYFPAGTYIVAPSPIRFLVLKSNVQLRGDGPCSVLRVKNGAGNYTTIFGQARPDQPVENITLSDFRVDQNPTGNSASTIQVGNSGTAQFVLYLTTAHRISVRNCSFDPCTGINTIAISGPASSNIEVLNNYFNFFQCGTFRDYDNSAIYMNNCAHQVMGNQFRAAIAQHARAAIETHNGQSVVSGNISDGYQTGCNIVTTRGVGGSVRENSDITVCSNTFSRACYGIMLWSQTGMVCRNVTIANNTISMAQVEHGEIASSGISMTLDTVSGKLNGDYENIIIANNNICFEQERARSKSRKGVPLAASTCYAIGLTPGGDVRNILVTGNILRNAPVKGIALGQTGSRSTNVRIVGNMIVDAGQNEGVIAGYRASLFVAGNLEDVTVVGNWIVDAGEILNGYQSFYVHPQSFNRVAIKDNNVSVRQGRLYESWSQELDQERGKEIITRTPTHH
jgi:hypothetical protein